MPKINKVMVQNLKGDNPELVIDLDEMFGTLVPDSSSFRQKVGQAIIDKIRERTSDGDFLNPPSKANQNYSKEYAESDEFKAYGKSKSDVNLKQTGDMLGLLDVVKEQKNAIVIGWEDKFQAEKAHGHITGNVGVKRDFLGLPMSDIEDIAEQFRDELPLGDIEPESSVQSIRDFVNNGSLKSFGDFIKSLTGEE
jgi:hypothetical protein